MLEQPDQQSANILRPEEIGLDLHKNQTELDSRTIAGLDLLQGLGISVRKHPADQVGVLDQKLRTGKLAVSLSE